jgi:hypothetical protein
MTDHRTRDPFLPPHADDHDIVLDSDHDNPRDTLQALLTHIVHIITTHHATATGQSHPQPLPDEIIPTVVDALLSAHTALSLRTDRFERRLTSVAQLVHEMHTAHRNLQRQVEDLTRAVVNLEAQTGTG